MAFYWITFFILLVNVGGVWAVTETLVAAQCYGSVLALKCQPGHKIKVLGDFFGIGNRTSGKNQCRYVRGDCTVPNSRLASLVHRYCEGKQSCASFQVDRRVCGTQGNYTTYEQVLYQCVADTDVLDICKPTRLTAKEGYIATPNFPRGYPTDLDCKCSVSVTKDTPNSLIRMNPIHLIVKYDMPCKDWLDVVMGNKKRRICGAYRSGHKGKNFILRFHSDSQDGHQGIWLYFAVDPMSSNSSLRFVCGPYIPTTTTSPTTTTVKSTTTMTTTTGLPTTSLERTTLHLPDEHATFNEFYSTENSHSLKSITQKPVLLVALGDKLKTANLESTKASEIISTTTTRTTELAITTTIPTIQATSTTKPPPPTTKATTTALITVPSTTITTTFSFPTRPPQVTRTFGGVRRANKQRISFSFRRGKARQPPRKLITRRPRPTLSASQPPPPPTRDTRREAHKKHVSKMTGIIIISICVGGILLLVAILGILLCINRKRNPRKNSEKEKAKRLQQRLNSLSFYDSIPLYESIGRRAGNRVARSPSYIEEESMRHAQAMLQGCEQPLNPKSLPWKTDSTSWSDLRDRDSDGDSAIYAELDKNSQDRGSRPTSAGSRRSSRSSQRSTPSPAKYAVNLKSCDNEAIYTHV